MRKLSLLAILLLPLPAWAVDCFVSEYSFITMMQDGQRAQAVLEPALAVQKVTFTTTSTQSAVFNAATRVIRVVCTAKAHFEISTNPTSTTADSYVAPDTAEYFGIQNTGLRISFKDES
jgi:hypothetical protein